MASQPNQPKRKIQKLSRISSNADGDNNEQKLDPFESGLKSQFEDEYVPPVVEQMPEHVQRALGILKKYLHKRKTQIEKRLEFTSSDMYHSDGLSTAYGENGYEFLPVDVSPTLPKDMQEVVQDMYRANAKNIEAVTRMKCDLINSKIQPFDKLGKLEAAMNEPSLYECVEQQISMKKVLDC